MTDQELRLFVGNKADAYLARWLKMADVYRYWTRLQFALPRLGDFNWSAFLAPLIWLGYRRLYLGFWVTLGVGVGFGFIEGFIEGVTKGALAFPTGWNVLFTLFICAWWGFHANWVYYRHAIKKVTALKTSYDHEHNALQIQQEGGTSWGGAVLGVLVWIVGLILSSAPQR